MGMLSHRAWMKFAAVGLMTAAIGLGVWYSRGNASEAKTYTFNYAKLEFREVASERYLPDFPPRPQEAGSVSTDAVTYLYGTTNSPRWMESYASLFHGGLEVEGELRKAQAGATFTRREKKEAQRRFDHLLSLRETASHLSPYRSEKRLVLPAFWVGSRNDDKALGGYGRADNYPRPIPTWLKVPKGQLTLVLRPDDLTAHAGAARGKAPYLVNTRESEAIFRARDSNLDLHCEAKAPDGSWVSIDELPKNIGFCGNSFHRVFLPANGCWKIAVPEYDGDYATMVRYRLDRGEKTETVSNEIPMKIQSVLLDSEKSSQ